MTMGRTAVRCPAILVLYFVCMGIWYPILAVKIMDMSAKGEVGSVANISCTVSSERADITWLFDRKPFVPDTWKTINVSEVTSNRDGETMKSRISIITITNATSKDAGNYTCMINLDEEKDERVVVLDLSFEGKLVNMTAGPIYLNATDNSDNPNLVNLTCVFEVYIPNTVKWYKEGELLASYDGNDTPINLRQIQSTYSKRISSGNDTGTYVCKMEDAHSVPQLNISGRIDIVVYDKPKMVLNEALAINTTAIFVNWTLFNYNSNILSYFVKIREQKPDTNFNFLHIKGGQTGAGNTSFVITNLNRSTEYELALEVETMHGKDVSNNKFVVTLSEDPVFVPKISINGFSATSVTIGWAAPEDEIKPFIHYYLLEATKKDGNETMKAYHPRDERNLPYMFDSLEPHSTYIFKVCACSYYVTEQCGNWSEKMEAATLDGQPTKPTNVHAECGTYHINLVWGQPEKPNAEIKGYTIELRGEATFTDRFGLLQNTTWGPLSKFTTNDTRNARFDALLPNTTYTVHISAMTRTRRRGGENVTSCVTKPAPPDQGPRARWAKIQEQDKYMFKMYLPRVSERNGPICCYRVYMVHLLPKSSPQAQIPPPREMPVLEYGEVHGQKPKQGAYITDLFSSKGFPVDSELVMGDSKTYLNMTADNLSEACRRCLMKRQDESTTSSTTSTTTTVATTIISDDLDVSTDDPTTQEPATPSRRRRNVDGSYSNSNVKVIGDIKLEDGPLDSTANYTLFVELIPDIENEPPVFSHYVKVLMPAPTPVAPTPATPLEIALQATCAVAALVLLLMIVFCIRQTRRSRKMPPHAHMELNPLQIAYRYITGLGGRPQMLPSVPPNMPPIAKEDLASAYTERQADSDYGFQKEFELLQILPECYPDRTTHASEARENQPKNRYPDIKAYDQTRVKLSQIDSITGSDYINANYVMGYQERKRFICAQGPTDTTINDFWRMIWEHGLELIVMLTNLEEYSKVKCSKYWPDEVRGARAFGNINVQHVGERRYSDYIVRELRITKQPTTLDGQPIVENNGVAKRNGDCKDAADGSVPTSPREVKDADARIVKQYHFLMWKDFAAPEHAYSILKFIKRVNEAWSRTVVRPCVVHCSAGVGRTGTLVALDCLLQQLHAEGRAHVFNTVAELRTQRNFLVQSLKQYVFVYRALVEYAHYGDTEIPAGRLKTTIDRLRNTPPGGTACLMEVEFEKILNSPIPEPLKSCAAGAAEELRSKNRSQEILPYDRNRVILAPIPTRDYSTYINASFIEAYDNSESFIITQDPLPSTIMDFWRMVSEHNVATIVMLSELGDGKCPRYWDDGTATYEHISVQYEESESCPYYTRRQFRLVNNKVDSGTSQSVRALQYQGWPTAVGAVPEVTRGLAELADAAANPPGTMLVHCQLGTERSALFVALCILICQLRTERRVDVCCVARKVRSQRARTIDTFSHYEFLHRAILNYAELHNLLEDS